MVITAYIKMMISGWALGSFPLMTAPGYMCRVWHQKAIFTFTDDILSVHMCILRGGAFLTSQIVEPSLHFHMFWIFIEGEGIGAIFKDIYVLIILYSATH